MNVTVNDRVAAWMQQQTPALKTAFNTKCTEAVNDDLSTWRAMGGSGGVYHYNATGNFRVVATSLGNNFQVSAIYKHGESKGKVLVCGKAVVGY